MSNRLLLNPYHILALVSGLVWGCVYFMTLTSVHTFDALSYIFDVSRKPWQESFHPHHLAYGPVGVFATWLADGGDAAIVMQRINASAGAAGVALLVMIVGRRWQRLDLSLIAAIALGGSYAFWYYAVEVEVYTLATFFLLWMIWLIDTPTPPHFLRACALGCAWCGAILFHQTNVLMLVPLLVVAGTDIWRQPTLWRYWVIVTCVAGILVGAAYAFVTLGVSGFRDVARIHAWLFHYAETGWWGGRGTLADLAQGISETLTIIHGGWLLVVGGVLVAPQLRSMQWQRWQGWLIAWGLCYGAFFFWWEPDNIEFWIAVTPVWILLWMTVWATLPPWHWRICMTLGLVIGMAYTNAVAIQQRGDARYDLQRDIARAIAAQSQPADLLLIPDGLQELYLPYYEQRTQFLSVNGLMTQYGNWAQACDAIHIAITRTQRAGAAVLIADDFLTPSHTMQQRFALPRNSVRTCLATDIPLMQLLPLTTPIPRHYRIPRPAEQLQHGTWKQLRAAPYGWDVLNATGVQGDSWRITVADDPAIISPILDVALPRYIGIRMQADGTKDGHAQLFVTDQINQFSETHALRWELQPGMNEYVIDLQQLANPPTRLIQLRLDPVASGAGGVVTITGIWIP